MCISIGARSVDVLATAEYSVMVACLFIVVSDLIVQEIVMVVVEIVWDLQKKPSVPTGVKSRVDRQI